MPKAQRDAVTYVSTTGTVLTPSPSRSWPSSSSRLSRRMSAASLLASRSTHSSDTLGTAKVAINERCKAAAEAKKNATADPAKLLEKADAELPAKTLAAALGSPINKKDAKTIKTFISRGQLADSKQHTCGGAKVTKRKSVYANNDDEEETKGSRK